MPVLSEPISAAMGVARNNYFQAQETVEEYHNMLIETANVLEEENRLLRMKYAEEKARAEVHVNIAWNCAIGATCIGVILLAMLIISISN